MAEHLAAFGRQHHPRELRQIRQQRGRRRHGAPWFGCRQTVGNLQVGAERIGLDRQQAVDEHAVAARRGHTARRRMRAVDQAEVFEVRHDVADRRRRQIKDF